MVSRRAPPQRFREVPALERHYRQYHHYHHYHHCHRYAAAAATAAAAASTTILSFLSPALLAGLLAVGVGIKLVVLSG